MSDETEQPRELTTTTGTAEIGSTIGVSEAAARLGKSEKTVRRLLAKNELAGAVKTPSATGDTWQHKPTRHAPARQLRQLPGCKN